MLANRLKTTNLIANLLIITSILSGGIMLLRNVNVVWYKFILDNFALFSDFDLFNYRLWQFITYILIHANFLHLALNMLMLYFFSQLFYTFFNNKQLINAYFLGGIFAGLFYFLIANVLQLSTFVVGASGAIMAVFFTVVGYNPKMRVQVIVFGNIPIYYIAIAFIFFDLFQLSFENAGGHLAHLGGSLFGFLYGKYLANGFNLNLNTTSKSKGKLKTVYKEKDVKNKILTNEVQLKIDSILDKISKSGYESLTQEEKEFLFKQK